MNTFNKKTLCAALAGLGALGLAGAAQAVSLNPDGLGQVLIYPYYTVRANADGNAYNSMLSVVNSQGSGKAVKVRFLEGKASHEVLDFNLYMSPYDVWTAVVFPTSDGAAVMTTDTTCTYGDLRALGTGGKAFANFLFSGSNADGEDATLDRTREGYVELIEMANIKDGTTTLTNISHVQGTTAWVPPKCSYIADGGKGSTPPSWTSDLTTGTGGLFGSMTLINVNNARSVGFNAVALQGFFDPITAAADLPAGGPANRVTNTLWFPSGDMNPNLSMAWPASSIVVTSKAAYYSQAWAGTSYNPASMGTWIRSAADSRDVFTPGLDAVSAALTRSTIYNEYMTDNSVAGATDWVVTMPTKGLYFDRDPANSTTKAQLNPRALFQRKFTTSGSCDDITFSVYGREEEKSQGSGWSPTQPGITSALCWEANVVAIQGPSSTTRNVLSAKNVAQLTSSYDNGWASLAFAPISTAIAPISGTTYSYTAHQLINTTTTVTPLTGGSATTAAATYTGLPMIGFATEVFNNGKVNNSTYGNVWASYANAYEHRYQRTIAP